MQDQQIIPFDQKLVQYYSYKEPLVSNSAKKSIQMDKFQKLCKERVLLLRKIEELHELTSDDQEQDINAQIIKEQNSRYPELAKLNNFGQSQVNLNEVFYNDNTAHYLLRMAYCRTEELLQWFIKQETRLYKARISKIPSKDLVCGSQAENIEANLIQQVDPELWEKQFEDIIFATHYHNNKTIELPRIEKLEMMKDYFQLPFQYVPFLVSINKVYLHRGIAIVYGKDISEVYIHSFEDQLKSELTRLQKDIKEVLHEKRIGTFLVNLNEYNFGNNNYQNQQMSKGKISIQDLENLVRRGSLPLCMRELYDHLKVEHHLKHMGRQQLGLFLKGAGLPLQESLQFWKQKFSGKITGEDFEKKYSYNIRHNYGKEGKRADYTPKGCRNIMTQMPGSGETHGCPFRYCNQSNLKKLLYKTGVKEQFQDDILRAANQQHFQYACRLTFQSLHPNGDEFLYAKVGNHPNAYLEASREYHEGTKDKQQQNQQQQQNNNQPIQQTA